MLLNRHYPLDWKMKGEQVLVSRANDLTTKVRQRYLQRLGISEEGIGGAHLWLSSIGLYPVSSALGCIITTYSFLIHDPSVDEIRLYIHLAHSDSVTE